MSISIVTVGSEKQVSISDDQMGRIMEVGSDWTQLMIIARLTFTDLGSNPGAGPDVQLGVMTDPTANMANGPQGSLSHFVGVDSAGTSWTRNAGPPVYYSGATSWRVKKVGATRTSAGGSGTVFSADPSRRQCWGVEIIKGSPNWTIRDVRPNSLSVVNALLDVTIDDFTHLLEQANATGMRDVLNVNTGSTSSYSSTGNTTAIDEATNGFLTSVVLTWNRATFLLRASDLWFSKRL